MCVCGGGGGVDLEGEGVCDTEGGENAANDQTCCDSCHTMDCDNSHHLSHTEAVSEVVKWIASVVFLHHNLSKLSRETIMTA